MATKKKEIGKEAQVVISPPNFQVAEFEIVGMTPYVSNAFPEKAREEMKAKQEAGSTGKKKTLKTAKDFQLMYKQSMHIAKEGWPGMPASAFRAAMISACRLVGFKMTFAKLSVFVIADGFDKNDGTPLIKFTKGEPHYAEHPVRLASGVFDIHARAMWNPGWEAKVQIKFDADQFTLTDVSNLLHRVGEQVGVGEGRADSRNSAGMGWGHFTIKQKALKEKAA